MINEIYTQDEQEWLANNADRVRAIMKDAEQPCAAINKAAIDQATAARKKYRSDTPISLYSIEGEDAVFVAAYLEAVSADQPVGVSAPKCPCCPCIMEPPDFSWRCDNCGQTLPPIKRESVGRKT